VAARQSGLRRPPLPAGGLAAALPPCAYLLLSLVLFGPIWGDLDSVVAGQNDIDPSGFIWCLAWWPNALLDGVGPFITDAIFVPDGYNLTWAASMPGPALVLAPITLLFSATVTFNLLMVLSPPLSAWAAYALCVHLTGARWPSFLGGYLFGFSPYMLGTITGGAPNLSMMALVPVMVLLVVRRAQGSLGAHPFVLLMAGLFVVQLLTGSEVMAMTTLFGGLTLVMAYVLRAYDRPALLDTARWLVAAYALAGLVLSPFLIAMLEPHSTPEYVDPRTFVNDVYSVFVPGELELGGDTLRGWWDGLGFDYRAGGAAYLGLPLLALIVAFTWRGRRNRRVLLVVFAFVMCLVASFGARLTVGGEQLMPLPWELFVHVPLFKYAIPMRFAAFAFLAVAVIVTMWLAARPSEGRWALALVSAAFLVPSFGAEIWHARADDPAFFRTDAYRAHLSEEDHVFTLPVWGKNTRWAARTQIGFRIAGGYVGSLPDSYTRLPVWDELMAGEVESIGDGELRRLFEAKGVTVVLTETRDAWFWQPLLDSLGVEPRESGGVLVYRLYPPGRAAR
jgi:hypothetical protein